MLGAVPHHRQTNKTHFHWLFKIDKTSAEDSRAEKVHEISASAILQKSLFLSDDTRDANGKCSPVFHPWLNPPPLPLTKVWHRKVLQSSKQFFTDDKINNSFTLFLFLVVSVICSTKTPIVTRCLHFRGEEEVEERKRRVTIWTQIAYSRCSRLSSSSFTSLDHLCGSDPFKPHASLSRFLLTVGLHGKWSTFSKGPDAYILSSLP